MKNYPYRENRDLYCISHDFCAENQAKILQRAVKAGSGTRHLGLPVWYLAHCCWAEAFLLLQLHKITLSHSGNVSL